VNRIDDLLRLERFLTINRTLFYQSPANTKLTPLLGAQQKNIGISATFRYFQESLYRLDMKVIMP
jgi:hypothetical protein